MSHNLKIAINMAKNSFIQFKRDTVIFVPKRLISQAYGIFTEMEEVKKWKYIKDHSTLKLAVGEITGLSDHHYETMYIINPHEMEDKVLDELKMVPDGREGSKPIIICIKI